MNAEENRENIETQVKLGGFMRLLLNNSPDILLLFDEQGELMNTTDSFLRKLHIDKLDLIKGKKYKDIFTLIGDEKWADAASADLESAIKAGKTFASEDHIDLTGSGRRYYKINYTPMIDEEGNTTGVIALFADVDGEHNARETAIAASSAKSDFLANMSHEMRTPLNAVIGMTNIGLAADDIEKKDYCLGKIGDASTHLLGVINDVLDMSKIEANKFELSPTNFFFEKMVQRVTNVVQFNVDTKSLEFIVNIDSNIPHYVIADEQRLAQVLANFLSNAVKFTPENGKIRMSIYKVGEDKPKGISYVQFTVSDTGIGIKPENMDRLFSSFEQADNSVARKYGGTGLGLAISKRIVEMMQGSMKVESIYGEGSTFSFMIPLRTGRGVTNQTLPKGIGWNNIRILGVDDSEETRQYFSNSSQSLGFYCDVAKDGYEALKLLEANEPYDVIFVDWKMPGMNGLELSEKIKKKFGDRSVVLMVSAVDWSTIEEDARAVGVDGFIPKPLFTSTLVDTVNNCITVEEHMIKSGAAEVEKKGRYDGVRILLAEDIEINREIVIGLFDTTGAVITTAENGIEVVELFAKTPGDYDVIFMDIHMPEMDGYEATRRIRAMDIPEAAKIPIIAMTANVFSKDIEKCLEVGMNDHVGKPLNVDEVMAKLTRQLERAWA